MKPHDPRADEPGQSVGMTAKERKHFWFAAILIFCCVAALPVLGAAWILLMRWGVIARP